MATVIIAIIVFVLVGLAVWYMIRSRIRHTGGCSCSGGCGGCSACGGDSVCTSCGDCAGHDHPVERDRDT